MTFSSVLSRRVVHKGLSSFCRVRVDVAHIGIRRFHPGIALTGSIPSRPPPSDLRDASPLHAPSAPAIVKIVIHNYEHKINANGVPGSSDRQSSSTSGRPWWRAWLEKFVGAGLVAGVFTVFYQVHEAHFVRASTRQGVGEAWALLRHYWRTVDNSTGRTHSSNRWSPPRPEEAGFRFVAPGTINGLTPDQKAFLQRVGEDCVDVMRALDDSGRVMMERRFLPQTPIQSFEAPSDGGDTKACLPSPSDSDVRRFEAATAYALEKAAATVWTHHLFLRRSDPVFRVPTGVPVFVWNIFRHSRFGFMPTHVSLGYEGCLMQDLNKVFVMRMAMYIVHGNQPALEGLKAQYREFQSYAWACYRANFLKDGDFDDLSQCLKKKATTVSHPLTSSGAVSPLL